MGMFDYITYEGHEYQTKDTPAQACDNYKIENNILWYENYDAEWIDDDDGFLGGCLKKFNERWDMCDKFDGLIRFYREDKKNGGWKDDKWIEYKALFMDGKILKIEKVDE
jgi:hypothetical protein